MKATISAPAREPSGRRQQPRTRAEREAARISRAFAETMQVRGQPHRVWAPEEVRGGQILSDALGRACVRLKLRQELHTAGEHYSTIDRRWRLCVGLPIGVDSPGTSAGAQASAETIRKIRDELERCERAMRKASILGQWAVRHLAIDGADIPSGDVRLDSALVRALVALAVHLGQISASEHPFSVDSARDAR